MTIEEALEAGNGKLFYVTTDTDYENYIGECEPASCTYYDSSFLNRFIHAITLTSALLGTIIRLARPVFVAASAQCSRCVADQDKRSEGGRGEEEEEEVEEEEEEEAEEEEKRSGSRC